MIILQSINVGVRTAILVFTWFILQYLLFFNCYLAAPRPTLSHYRGDSLTHPMLITAFYIFEPKVTGSLATRFGSLSPAERLAEFEPGTFRFLLQRFNPKLSFVNDFTFSCCFHVFLKIFCVSPVDVNRGKGRGEGGGCPNF